MEIIPSTDCPQKRTKDPAVKLQIHFVPVYRQQYYGIRDQEHTAQALAKVQTSP